MAELKRLPAPKPVIKPKEIEAHVLHVDRFGNLITDLRQAALIEWLGRGGKARVQAGSATITRLSRFYAQVEPGEPLALIASSDRLEISVADEGEHFDMTKVPDPLSNENLMRDSGRGLLLMQAFMDEFQVRPCQPRGTEVKLVKYLAKAG